ncbi:Xylulose kinase [Rubripirellula lacrimiformis]|uniref:Xylulose kinase n=1 Tax=Rubripirellula lacrimiformis TaxID=1930273 RepID=A0A517N6X7_9BACT|nr:xylulokinase [Rubripirellula lacrimiformis]QDT02882.1 Xylulose kinase [Rubripirellula lacrimiformis]
MNYYLGIDVGTSGTKTLLIDAAGAVIAEADAEYPMHQPKPGWTEQDPEDWWKATVKTVRAVIKKSKVKPDQVKAIGLSGQMHGSVFLDKNDNVIRNALLWNDQRTSAECDEITAAAGGRKGLIKMVANPALTGFQAPKVLWLRNNEKRNFDKLAKVLLPKDDIRRRLTGGYVTEVSDASGTLFLDVVKRKWSTKLIGKLGLDADLLPEVVESDQVTGTLTAEAAKKLGLTTDCKVVGGAGDCAAGAVGNGVVKSGVLSTSIGTSGVMFVHSDQPQYDADGRLHTFCHAVNGKWHMMGVNLTSGGSLQWWVDSVLRGLAGVPDAKRYEAATAEAAAVVAGSDGLLFLPYLNGERTPHADPNARGSFVGMNLTHTRGHMTRSVMEGITFALRDSLEIITSMGVPVRQVRASGGGSKNPMWRQMQADVFGKKVTTLAVEQGPAFGVALLAAVGDGAYKSIEQACAATIKVADETKADRAAVKKYDQLFPIYRDLYGQLKESMGQLAKYQAS